MKGVRFFAGLCLLILAFFIVGNQPVAAQKEPWICYSGFVQFPKDVVEKQSDPATFLRNARKGPVREGSICRSKCQKFVCLDSDYFFYGVECGEKVRGICDGDKDELDIFWQGEPISTAFGNFAGYKCRDSRCEKSPELEKEHVEATLRLISKVTGKEFTTSTFSTTSSSFTTPSTSTTTTTTSTTIQPSPENSTLATEEPVTNNGSTAQPVAITKRPKPATENPKDDNSGDDQDNGATQSGIQLLGMAMMAFITRWIYGLL